MEEEEMILSTSILLIYPQIDIITEKKQKGEKTDKRRGKNENKIVEKE